MTGGLDIPALGFGTYGRWGAEGEAALRAALEAGYRHLDTAQSYDTEGECGRAIRASGLPRETVFVTTKIKPENFGPGQLVPSLRRSLKALGLDQVDLTLLHWPAPHGQPPLSVYVPQLAEAQAAGLTRHIGVSNFTIALIDETLALLDGRPILTNQVELHPYLQNRKLEAHCQAKGIRITAYRPIAKGRVGVDAVLGRIAKAHGATPAQVTLAWHLAAGRVAIPTSGKPERIRENFGALKLTLTASEIAEIAGLERGNRAIDPATGPDWD